MERRVKRGEVWTVSGGPDYAGKPRPVVVIQDDRFDATDSVTVCGLTTVGAETPLYTGRIVQLNGMRLVAAVSSSSDRLRLNISLRFGSDGSARGTVRATSLGATT